MCECVSACACVCTCPSLKPQPLPQNVAIATSMVSLAELAAEYVGIATRAGVGSAEVVSEAVAGKAVKNRRRWIRGFLQGSSPRFKRCASTHKDSERSHSKRIKLERSALHGAQSMAKILLSSTWPKVACRHSKRLEVARRSPHSIRSTQVARRHWGSSGAGYSALHGGDGHGKVFDTDEKRIAFFDEADARGDAAGSSGSSAVVKEEKQGDEFAAVDCKKEEHTAVDWIRIESLVQRVTDEGFHERNRRIKAENQALRLRLYVRDLEKFSLERARLNGGVSETMVVKSKHSELRERRGIDDWCGGRFGGEF